MSLDCVWTHFWRAPLPGNIPGSKDKTNHEARCLACVAKRVSDIRQQELNMEMLCDDAPLARTEKDIKDELLGPPLWEGHPDTHNPKRLVGKVDVLLQHVVDCPSEEITDGSRALARTRLQVRAAEAKERQMMKSRMSNTSNGAALRRTDSTATLVDGSVSVRLDRDGRPLQQQKLYHVPSAQQEPAVFIAQPAADVWTRQRAALFNAMLCRLLIVCNIAWRSVEQPYWRHFFETWLPGVPMAGRNELSGRILDAEADQCVDNMKRHVSGKFATGQCDGWKDTCKSAIIAFMMNVEYMPWLVNSVDTSRQQKDAKTLLQLVLDEIQYAVTVLKLIVIAWCTDASGESAKMRRLLVNKFRWIVVLDCWAHQINLIVGDMLKVKDFESLVTDALEVVKWFRNHSLALGMLRGMSMEKLGKELSLILPVITRWTAHYLSVCRLLELENPMRHLLLDSTEKLRACAGKKREAKEQACKVLAILQNHQFWENLRSVKKHLEPLARAANATQSDCARLDVVLVTLANLYHYFSSTEGLVQDAATAVLASLERRWAKADQDIFILALVLNPYIRLACFAKDSPFRMPAQIRQLAEAAFVRFYNVPPGVEFGNELVNYLSKKGTWSDDQMKLKHLKEQAKREGVEVNLITIWREWSPISDDDDDTPDSSNIPTTGAGRLALLSMRILAMVPNSAAVERIFSLFGIVHTKLRNRLGKEKVRKQVLVHNDTMRAFGTGSRLKRKFGEDSDDDNDAIDGDLFQATSRPTAADNAQHVDSTPEVAASAQDGGQDDEQDQSQVTVGDTDFMATFRELVAATEVDGADEEADRADAIAGPVSARSEARLLKNMFRYPQPGETTRSAKILTHYWAVGERNLQREAQFHDDVHRARATQQQQAPGASNAPAAAV